MPYDVIRKSYNGDTLDYWHTQRLPSVALWATRCAAFMKDWELLLVIRTPPQVTTEERSARDKHFALIVVQSLPPEERRELIRSFIEDAKRELEIYEAPAPSDGRPGSNGRIATS